MRIDRVVIVLVALLAIVSIAYFFFVGFVIWGSDYSEIMKMSGNLVFLIAANGLLAYSCMLKTRNAKHLAAGAMFLALSQMLGLPFFYLMITNGPIYEMLWTVPVVMLGLGVIYLLRFFREEMK
jgi:hypothetical protein